MFNSSIFLAGDHFSNLGHLQVEVIVAEESWSTGRLEEQNLYEDEREVTPDDDEEDLQTAEEDGEFDEVRNPEEWFLNSIVTIFSYACRR